MLLLVASGPVAEPRIGFTVSRKVGKAVVRNMVRRRLREIVRSQGLTLCPELDHVVVAFSTAATARYATLYEELRCLLERASAWASARRSSSR